MTVSYELFEQFPGWNAGFFRSLVAEHSLNRILEIGSGAEKNLDPGLSGSFDFVFSRMVGEHVKEGLQYI
jgi:hypothetical protein